METIDLTPTWQAALSIYMAAYEHGSPEGRKAAIEGLKQMADTAQAYADLHKKCIRNQTSLKRAVQNEIKRKSLLK